MSEYYYNEKEGRYEPISEASFGARINGAKRQRDDLTDEIREIERSGQQSFQNLKTGYHAGDVEKAARQTSDYTSYQSNTKKEPKKKKGGIISLGFFIWILYMLFRGNFGESIRRFFEDLF